MHWLINVDTREIFFQENDFLLGNTMNWLIDADTGEIIFQDQDYNKVFEVAKITRNVNNNINICIIRG